MQPEHFFIILYLFFSWPFVSSYLANLNDYFPIWFKILLFVIFPIVCPIIIGVEVAKIFNGNK